MFLESRGPEAVAADVLPDAAPAGEVGWVWKLYSVVVNDSGQIIAISHDLTPNGGLVREIPLFQESLGW